MNPRVAPKCEFSRSIIYLLSSAIFPGITQIIAGVVHHHQDSIAIGVSILLLFFGLSVFLFFFMPITFGINFLFIPLFALIPWSWSVFWV
jgi:hypothetical protein